MGYRKSVDSPDITDGTIVAADIAAGAIESAKLNNPLVLPANTTATTPTAGDDDTSVATTAFVQNELGPESDEKSVRVYRTAVLAISSGTETLIPFTAESHDNGGFHDNATNNSRVIAPEDGTYQINAQCSFDANGTGQRYFLIRKNAGGSAVGGTLMLVETQGATPSPTSSAISGADSIELVEGDYIEMFAYQNSGGNLDVLGSEAGTKLSMSLVAPRRFNIVEQPAFDVQAFTASGTISAVGGSVVTFAGAASQTLTLPSASVGTKFEVWNIDTADGVAVARGGSDTIVDNLTTGATTFNVPAGAKAVFECVSASTWHAGYSTTVTNSGEFMAGAGTGNKSETGIGFRPKVVHFSMDTGINGSNHRSHTGFMAANGTQSTTSNLGSVAASDANMYSNASACISATSSSGAATDLATYVSMDADGFTVNFSINGTASDWFYIAMA